MINFKAGDKVVCVDDSPCIVTGEPIPLNLGGIYCVSEAFVTDDGNYPVVMVIGHSPRVVDDTDLYYMSSRFRLVSELKLIMEAVRKNAIGKEVETHTVAKP